MKSLLELKEYYEENLCDRSFQYVLENGQTIEVLFFRESFCHLLGVQHISQNKNFLGKKGFDAVSTGTLTAALLKKINGAAFGRIRLRLEYFDRIASLMENAYVFKFYPERVPSNIAADILLYQQDVDLYLHLFLAK